EGRRELPPSVLAMLQLRMAELPESARRALRAGSIFGGSFVEDAVAALLGQPALTTAGELDDLVAREWLWQNSELSRSGGRVYVFRHDLVREAAYATLTDRDRVLGHRLAADWLERSGESEAIVVAEHCDRAGDGRAVGWYRKAAEQAMEGNDLEACIERASRAVACGASAETLGEIRALQAEAHNWRMEWSEAERCALEAMQCLPRGTPLWAHALHQRSWSASSMGRSKEVEELAGELLDGSRGQEFTRFHVLAYANVASHLQRMSQREKATALLRPLALLEAPTDDVVAGTVAFALATWEFDEGNLSKAHALLTRAQDHFMSSGDLLRVALAREAAHVTAVFMGDFERAAAGLRQLMQFARAHGLRRFEIDARVDLALCLGLSGEHREAVRLIREAIAAYGQAQVFELLQSGNVLSRLLYLASDFAGAEREAARVLEQEGATPIQRVHALAARAQALTALHQIELGLEHARQALALLDSIDVIDEWDAFVRLVHAEALHQSGDAEGARAAIRFAKERLLVRAALLDSPEFRATFLAKVPENARTLRLSALWLEEAPISAR
ncbi:MAG TPA: hypothetical protein VK524_31700, partial [Polyangiaceae bacterium]|nr:hypothetical protein [Polyangiaceae bacterium]